MDTFTQLRRSIAPIIQSFIDQIDRLEDDITSAYAQLASTPSQAQPSDLAALAEIRKSARMLRHNAVHIRDVIPTIGQRSVDKYFNVDDSGELVEVDKEHFVGLPDEAE